MRPCQTKVHFGSSPKPPLASWQPFPLSIDCPEDPERIRLLIDETYRHTSPPFSMADVLAACRASLPATPPVHPADIELVTE